MLEHPEDYSYEQIKQMINQIATTHDKALAALAYGTGARVSELNQIEKDAIRVEGEYLIIRCKVLKKKDGKEHSRYPVIRLTEEWLIKPILEYKESCLTDILFPYYRMKIYRNLLRNTGFNPHGFRKLRATHLRRNFGFDSYQLKKFFGWSSISPSEYYVGLDVKDIMY